MTKDALTELLANGELNIAQEREKRPDKRIWEIVEKELGGAYVVALFSSGGFAHGQRVTPAPTIEAIRLQRNKYIEGLQRYDELKKLEEPEIRDRYIESIRLKLEREQQEYISKFRLGADFSNWSKMAFWTYREGAALIHGLDPDLIKSRERTLTKTRFPIIKSWVECKEHAFRAVIAGLLESESEPAEFIRWAESLGYPIPQGLQGLSGECEAIATSAIDDASSASGTSLKELKRENVLSPIINQAIKECGNSKTAEVWNKLRDYAKAQKTPFYGIAEEGLQYMNQDDIPKALSKRALGDRLKRLSKSR